MQQIQKLKQQQIQQKQSTDFFTSTKHNTIQELDNSVDSSKIYEDNKNNKDLDDDVDSETSEIKYYKFQMQREQEKKRQEEQRKIEMEIQEDLKHINVDLKNMYTIKRSQSTEQILAKSYKIKDIIINTPYCLEEEYPFTPDFTSQYINLLDTQVIKQFELFHFRERFSSILKSQAMQELTLDTFWLVFCLKFPKQCQNDIYLQRLKEKINHKFTVFYNNLAKPKEEFLNYIIFGMTYLIHKTFFEYFVDDRQIFTLRFILDCYHLVIFEINGLNVTDYFLQVNIDRIFSYKFLDYEKNSSLQLKNRKIIVNKDKNYFGTQLVPPQPKNEEQRKFLGTIKNVFKKQPIKQNKLPNQNKNKFGVNSIMSNQKFKKGSQSKSPDYKSRQLLQQKSIDSIHNSEEEDSNIGSPISKGQLNLQRNVSSQQKPWNTHNQSFIISGNRNHKLMDAKMFQKIKRNKKVDLESLQNGYHVDGDDQHVNIAPSMRVKTTGKDITFQRLRFNLNGISPTLKDELGYRETTLPDTVQKIIFHPIDRTVKMNNFNKLAETSKQQFNLKQRKIELKIHDSDSDQEEIDKQLTQEAKQQQQFDNEQKHKPKTAQASFRPGARSPNGRNGRPSTNQNSLQNSSQNKDKFNKTLPEFNKFNIKPEKPQKSLLAQYDISNAQVDQNEIMKNRLQYKDMLELKAVLNVYREKTLNWPSSQRLYERKQYGKKDEVYEKAEQIEQMMKKHLQKYENQQKISKGKNNQGTKFYSPQPRTLPPVQEVQIENNDHINEQSLNNSKNSDRMSDMQQFYKQLKNQFIGSDEIGSFNNKNKQFIYFEGQQNIEYDIDEKEKVFMNEQQQLNNLEKEENIYEQFNKNSKNDNNYQSKTSEYNQKYGLITRDSSKIYKNQDEIKHKLIRQKAALSKKGAGWQMFQHLIDFDD